MRESLLLVLELLFAQASSQIFCAIPSLCQQRSGDITIDPRGGNPIMTSRTSNGRILTKAGEAANCSTGYAACEEVRCGSPPLQPTQTNGPATLGAFPWHVFLTDNSRLRQNNGYAGGGVLIDPHTVLTAAHKVSNLTNIGVIAGVYNISNPSTAQVKMAVKVFRHSSYNPTHLTNDVAILRLGTPMLTNSIVMPICLPEPETTFVGYPATSCVVTGWGQSTFGVDDAPTRTLKQAHIPIVTNAICNASYNSILGPLNAAAYLDFPNEICAGGQANVDSCSQDGGSPLVCRTRSGRYDLAGLVLWGKNCGVAGRYGVYLNVPRYVDWIQCTMACILDEDECDNCPATRLV